MLVSLIVAVILSILAALLANENQVVVTIRVRVRQLDRELRGVVLVALGSGALVWSFDAASCLRPKGWALMPPRRSLKDVRRAVRAHQASEMKQA